MLYFFFQSVDSQLSLSAVSQSDSASSTQSLTHGSVPELLVGLSYNATTGRMSVELIKGSHFRNLAVNRPPGLQWLTITHCIFQLQNVAQLLTTAAASVPRQQVKTAQQNSYSAFLLLSFLLLSRHLWATDSAELGGTGDLPV